MFKESFKYYKSKNPPPTFEKVLDLNQISDRFKHKVVYQTRFVGDDQKLCFGLKSAKTWEVYQFVNKPGLFVIKNPFTNMGQRYWTIRCLKDYSKKPNKANIDALNVVPENKHWWDMCQDNKDVLLLDKLRWVTLGYHHNWDTKVYDENDKSEFPKDLADLAAYIANILGFPNFVPEAAIVNFYHMNSTLAGHTDHSEPNLEAPLFSLSFGQTAIFLIGGKTKEEKPLPVFLRSGDIVVMSRESRVYYHGVPKILQNDSRLWELLEDADTACSADRKDTVKICKNDELWAPFGSYLNKSRININIRQVLNRGQKRLNSDGCDADMTSDIT